MNDVGPEFLAVWHGSVLCRVSGPDGMGPLGHCSFNDHREAPEAYRRLGTVGATRVGLLWQTVVVPGADSAGRWWRARVVATFPRLPAFRSH